MNFTSWLSHLTDHARFPWRSSRKPFTRRKPATRCRPDTCRTSIEALEERILLTGDIDVTLDPLLDQFGFQPETIQVYEDKVSLGAIFDTGASVVTFSSTDQFVFDPTDDGTGIPIKVKGGAEAEGVGGTLTGDVSEPGTIRVDGIQISVFSGDIFGGDGGLFFDELQGLGTVDDAAPAANQFSGTDRLNSKDDIYNGFTLLFTSGDLSGQSRTILDFDGATRTFTVAAPFSAAPATGDGFHVIVDQSQVAGPLPARDVLSGDAGLSNVSGTYIGRYLLFTSGPSRGEVQLITEYDGATHTFEFGLPFENRPDIGDTFEIIVGTGSSAITPDVQVFVGTFEGSNVLPTISGTPMLNPSPLHPDGVALNVGPQGFLLDLGELLGDLFPNGLFDGFIIPIPSVEFFEPGKQLEVSESFHAESTVVGPTATASQFRGTGELLGGTEPEDAIYADFYVGFQLRFLTGDLRGEIQQVTTYDRLTRSFGFATPFSAAPGIDDRFELVRKSTEPVTIALDFIGIDNHLDPGDIMTVSPNPVSNQVAITQDGVTLTDQVFLYDTGAQLTTISVDQALSLNFDLDAPEFSISVQGAGGVVADLPGFTMDEMSIPTLEGGHLTFHDVPVFVIDVAEEIQGLMGMNLFNNGSELLYDPFDPDGQATLQATFFSQRAEVIPEIDSSELSELDSLLLESILQLLPGAAAQTVGLKEIQLPGFGVGVDLDLIPDTGAVSSDADGRTVVTVSPGTAIGFTTNVAFSADFYDSFQLEFGDSDAALSLRDWVTDAAWTASDGTLDSPADSSVAAAGSATLSATLGTFVVDAPNTPGDYLLTADDALDSTTFFLAGNDPLDIRDFSDVIIRVQDVPTLSISDAILIEGAAGETAQVQFTVTLSGEATGTVTVDYTTADSSAVASEGDFTATNGTLTFPAGVTEQTISVSVNGDAAVEADESFFVQLSDAAMQVGPLSLIPISDATASRPGTFSPFDQLESLTEPELKAGATPTSRAFAMEFDVSSIPAGTTVDSATLTFVETTDTVDPSFLPAGVYGYAGNGDGAVTLANPFNTLLSNQVGTVGNQTVGTESIDVKSFIQSLVDGNDSLAGFYVETALDEYHIHSSEAVNSGNRPTLAVDFGTSTTSVGISDAQGTATIRNDDTAITISDREQFEGDSGETAAAFVVQLAQPSALNVSVSYTTAEQTATAGGDFQTVNGVVTFSPGQTTKSILVPIIGDTDDESDETFVIDLSSAGNATITDNQAVGKIVDDESSPMITSAAAVDAAENQTGVIDVQSTDPDGETENGGGLSYALTGGADKSLFSINAATGVLTFNTAPDFENPVDAGTNNVYDVQVTVTDSDGLTGVQNLQVTVTDVFLLDEMRFEAETDLFHQIGRLDADGWSANTGQDTSGFLSYGPYTTDVPAGTNTAGFRLMVDNNTADNFQVVNLDVFDVTAGQVLAERAVTRQEFDDPFAYQDFALDFANEEGHLLEFRTRWMATSYVRHDRVSVTVDSDVTPSPRIFQAETDLFHQIGRLDADGWSAGTNQDALGFLNFGPYTSDVSAGAHTADFRLLVDNNTADNHPVAIIDVVDATAGQVLINKTITRQEFNDPFTYQDFTLDFTNEAGHLLEFRTQWLATSYVRQDKVTVTANSDPAPGTLTFQAETDLFHQIGRLDADGWSADTNQDAEGFLSFGPYTVDVAAGTHTADFRLLVDNNTADNHPVAIIDIVDATVGQVLANRTVTREEFDDPLTYQNFSLDFTNEEGHLLEFRTRWLGTSYVRQDSVQINSSTNGKNSPFVAARVIEHTPADSANIPFQIVNNDRTASSDKTSQPLTFDMTAMNDEPLLTDPAGRDRFELAGVEHSPGFSDFDEEDGFDYSVTETLRVGIRRNLDRLFADPEFLDEIALVSN